MKNFFVSCFLYLENFIFIQRHFQYPVPILLPGAPLIKSAEFIIPCVVKYLKC